MCIRDREYTSTTCIIILEINSTLIGIAVDTVLQVQDIDTAEASPIPVENRQELTNAMISLDDGTVAVSYTHLDVYKRQPYFFSRSAM